MGEERGAVRIDNIETFVEAVLGGDGEVLVEELVHGAVEKPAAVQVPLAAGRDELAHSEQFEHFAPGHLGFAIGQALAPELGQVQFVPETAGEPAVAEAARALEREFGQLYLQAVECVGRNLAVGGEERDLLCALGGLIEGFELLAPRRLLGVVDLAEIEDGALGGAIGAQAAVFDDAPVAVNLAVFFASVEAQEHESSPAKIAPRRHA